MMAKSGLYCSAKSAFFCSTFRIKEQLGQRKQANHQKEIKTATYFRRLAKFLNAFLIKDSFYVNLFNYSRT